MSYFLTPQILSKPVGNNAFSYEQRKKHGSGCKLYVPDVITGGVEDIIPSKHIVFEEVDEKGNLHTCTGLDHIYKIIIGNTPTYIMDNHNYALYLRYREYHAARLRAGATLIHIDQHADMGIPETPIDTASTDNMHYIANYVVESCNVGNFIHPALQTGLVQETIQVRSVSKLLQIGGEKVDLGTIDIGSPHLKETGLVSPLILDIDIDFRSDHIPTHDEKLAVQRLLQQADICTIALSPYFMDINKAIDVLREVVNYEPQTTSNTRGEY